MQFWQYVFFRQNGRKSVCPIRKSEVPQKPENYRGISMNDIIGKPFNIILYNILNKFLKENNHNIIT